MGNSRVESVVKVRFGMVRKVGRALCFLCYVSCALFAFCDAMIDRSSFFETG